MVDPTIEERSRGHRIDVRRKRAVLLPVLQHVHERIPYLKWACEWIRVVAIHPERSTTSHDFVDASGETDPKSLHSASKGPSISRLDDEMDVIVLNREVRDSKLVFGDARSTTSFHERARNCCENALRAKHGNAAS